jgi:hypothetical protein
LVVSHLFDVVVERSGGVEERLEIAVLAEALQVSLVRVPLDVDDLLGGLVGAAGRLPALAVR